MRAMDKSMRLFGCNLLMQIQGFPEEEAIMMVRKESS